MEHYSFNITENLLPSRIDKLLGSLSDLSRESIKKLIKLGLVTIDGAIVEDTDFRVTKECVVEVKMPEKKESHMVATDIPLTIVYEDSDIIVINKQAGLTVHPGNGTQDDTLVNALLSYCPSELSSINGEQRPGIVHRLDRDTTGLIVVAKNNIAHNILAEQIAEKSAQRKYYAIVWGIPKPLSGIIDTQIGRHKYERTKMCVVTTGGKHAVTEYKVQKIFKDGQITLVECILQTGRTHQIRIHMNHIGHSVVGDQTYGQNSKKFNKYLKEKEFSELIQRQLLHAHSLSFLHPTTQELMEFKTDLPEDMQKIVSKYS